MKTEQEKLKEEIQDLTAENFKMENYSIDEVESELESVDSTQMITLGTILILWEAVTELLFQIFQIQLILM